MSFVSNILGGGSRPSAPSGGGGAPSLTTSIIREAPGIEERKIELMDLARQVAQKPVAIPDIKVAPFGALEQQGLTAAGTTGVGAPTTTAGIGSILTAAQPVGSQQIGQFMNPFQQFVTDEILRQGAGMQNRLAAQAVRAGAFGGGREGVQQAELQDRILSQIGQAQQQGFNTALQAAQDQQRVGLGAGQQLWVTLTDKASGGNSGGIRIIPEKLHVRYDAGNNYYAFNLELMASDYVIGV